MRDRDYDSDDRRPKQTPRFNKNAFKAQQASQQSNDTQGNAASTPVYVSDAPPARSFDRPRPAFKDRQPREDRPQRDNVEMTLEQYVDTLNKTEWLFNQQSINLSFFQVATMMEEQIRLYHLARKLGPKYMEAFAKSQITER